MRFSCYIERVVDVGSSSRLVFPRRIRVETL